MRIGIISSNSQLAGKRILVTRPRHQADQICHWIEGAGGHAVRLPLLEIADPQGNSRAIHLLKRLERFDMGIFISANAVRKTHDLMNTLGLRFPSDMTLTAIGGETAKTLREIGYRVNTFPQHTFNSETFLAMPEVNNIAGLHIAIFKGVGGRDLLRQELLKRGANVEYVEVYRRAKPSLADIGVWRILTEGRIDLITITSSEALQNLHALITESDQLALFDVCLLAGSQRIAEKARVLNFTTIITASDPSDSTMLSEMIRWATKSEHDP